MDESKMKPSKNFEDRTNEDMWDAISRQNPKGELMSSDPFFQFLRKRLYDDTTKVNHYWRRFHDVKNWVPSPYDTPEDTAEWKQLAIRRLKEDLASDMATMRKQGPIGRWAERQRQEYRDRNFEAD
jgi:hypothetical protein